MLCYHVDAVTVAASSAAAAADDDGVGAVFVVAIVLLAEISLLLQLNITISLPPYPDRSFFYASLQF